MVGAEMHGVAASQILGRERRDCDTCGLEVGERSLELLQIVGID
jgi:hypothetical protein